MIFKCPDAIFKYPRQYLNIGSIFEYPETGLAGRPFPRMRMYTRTHYARYSVQTEIRTSQQPYPAIRERRPVNISHRNANEILNNAKMLCSFWRTAYICMYFIFIFVHGRFQSVRTGDAFFLFFTGTSQHPLLKRLMSGQSHVSRTYPKKSQIFRKHFEIKTKARIFACFLRLFWNLGRFQSVRTGTLFLFSTGTSQYSL